MDQGAEYGTLNIDVHQSATKMTLPDQNAGATGFQ